MRVKMLKDRSEEIDRITTTTWPAGWVGDVDDAMGERWVSENVAEAVNVPPPAPTLTEEQVALLGSAADEMVASAVNAEPEDIGHATVTELRAQAIARGVPGAARMKKAELVAALG